MMRKLENLISSLNFTEAKSVVDRLSENEIESFFIDLAFKTENILFYTFIFDMIKENEKASLHYIASLILSQPLCHLEGAYQAAFFHAKRAVELDEYDVELKEYLLLFNDIPSLLHKSKQEKTGRRLNDSKGLEPFGFPLASRLNGRIDR
ncbi:hypothetical protein GCM10011571_04400 [Marinithermofilum abyssi]|uniref:Uncharacterized protein n=1 Tax=Marinithermofilum abyssi TaxID=1571185 RepID=A0A8J2VG22_9BACL|nr:hypothetical protein [Marinithermofilum abyssi]GGE06394.1 hypothetical protein GCM10011571_04400 [Marinithermofilum abyssi]